MESLSRRPADQFCGLGDGLILRLSGLSTTDGWHIKGRANVKCLSSHYMLPGQLQWALALILQVCESLLKEWKAIKIIHFIWLRWGLSVTLWAEYWSLLADCKDLRIETSTCRKRLLPDRGLRAKYVVSLLVQSVSEMISTKSWREMSVCTFKTAIFYLWKSARDLVSTGWKQL